MPGRQYAETAVYDRGVLPISAGADVTAATASARVGAFDDRTQAVRFSVQGADVRVKFGDSTVTVTASTGYRLMDGMTDVFQVPPGATHFAYIREDSTDASLNYVELG